ncbi:ABC transporter related protein [Pyrobaculum islandicum DSM 4184]|uniref:ABC transporter related protein n=1 Tax=Pyrobaculum islandicum (strain DSM 4184 / JCM 9189 / GEO3) TaxID=384616 RepID=A1RR10_PYRIL|nr:ABC transporter ATP-binding protein [Pyrobaculum islandicum]ABL87392.1 ABC transporter related protein [Pyrobaculum islandicum DSM 4184]
MRREVLKAVDVYFGYSEDVLKGVSLSVGEGQFMAVMGPTGSGKTTLLLVLAGLLKPRRGEVYFMGEPLEGQLPAARRLMGVVFQNPDDMFFNHTVRDEIAYTAVRIYGREEGLKLAEEAAKALGIEGLLDRPPYKLSGGQKRLVTLAAATVHRPRLLLLDEPTTYLDEDAYEVVVNYLAKLKAGGVSAVIATHDEELAVRLADSVYKLREGKLTPYTPRRKLC